MSDCKSCTWETIKNAAKATASAAKHLAKEGYILADQSIIEARRKICEGCQFKSGLRCKACGCFTEAKTMLVTESCPKGAW